MAASEIYWKNSQNFNRNYPKSYFHGQLKGVYLIFKDRNVLLCDVLPYVVLPNWWDSFEHLAWLKGDSVQDVHDVVFKILSECCTNLATLCMICAWWTPFDSYDAGFWLNCPKIGHPIEPCRTNKQKCPLVLIAISFSQLVIEYITHLSKIHNIFCPNDSYFKFSCLSFFKKQFAAGVQKLLQ